VGIFFLFSEAIVTIIFQITSLHYQQCNEEFEILVKTMLIIENYVLDLQPIVIE